LFTGEEPSTVSPLLAALCSRPAQGEERARRRGRGLLRALPELLSVGGPALAAGGRHGRARGYPGHHGDQHPHPEPHQAEARVGEEGRLAEAHGLHTGGHVAEHPALEASRRPDRKDRPRRTQG